MRGEEGRNTQLQLQECLAESESRSSRRAIQASTKILSVYFFFCENRASHTRLKRW